jgi:HEAT repeat protein
MRCFEFVKAFPVAGLLLGLSGAWLLTGCSASPSVVKTALHGDLAALKREVASSQKSGSLDADVVDELAWAVAGREVRSAKGPDATSRIHGLSTCAGPLEEVLAERAARRDAAGAAAMLVLIETGRRDPMPLVAEYAQSADGAWRAVGARGTFIRRHATLRRHFLRDPDERVRRTALDAAIAAADPDDTDDLLEAARLDPDPVCQSKAARALGAIGGPRAVLGLEDRFATSDEMLASSIVDAWAMPRAFVAGGEHALTGIVETADDGLPLLTAALALARIGQGTTAELGAGALARIIDGGTQSEQLAAVGAAPLSDPRVRTAVTAASRSSDEVVRVAALERLALSPNERARSLAGLHELIRGKGSAKQAAALALAGLHDDAAAAVLDASLAERSSSKRREAALGLLDLSRYSSVATALADDDPGVRTSVACSVLAKTR